jgi:flagellar hook-associated protein 1 FlgK
MGLTSSLSVGRTALAAYQAALEVVGNNIANSATPGYVRISPQLSAVPGPTTRAGQIGGGVNLSSLKRHVNASLEARLRTALSDKESASAEQLSLDRVENVFSLLGDRNLATLIGEFFSSLGDLQNNPENLATRGIVLDTADALAASICDIRADLIRLRDDLNEEIEGATGQADEIAAKIAELNTQITVAEAGSSGPAAGLRNQRDQLLTELAELFAITVREQPSGAMNVYIGNESLIQFGMSFGLKTVTETDSDGYALAVVRFQHNNAQIRPPSGLVEGLINSRDNYLANQMSRLDTLAAGLIREINNIHAGGKGLEGFSQLTALTEVTDPTQALSLADNGITFLPQTGSFFIDVKDTATGTVVRTQIHIDLDGIGTDSTLDSVAADITANVAGVTATVLSTGRLQLTASGGSTFTFADDTSGFLAALGLNAFFSGKDSSDIAVYSLLAGNPALLAAAKSDLPGDGSNATDLASLQDQAVSILGGVSLNDYYTATMSNIAVSLSGARSAAEAGAIIFDSLTAQREALSGVSLDEETVSLITYQRAYQAAARFVNVVDEMMQVLLSLVR